MQKLLITFVNGVQAVAYCAEAMGLVREVARQGRISRNGVPHSTEEHHASEADR